MRRPLSAGVAFAALAPLALPHDLEANEDYVVPLPGQEITGAVVFATLLGPPEGPTVVHAELDLVFTTSGPGSAANARIELGVMVDDAIQTWVVKGSDLGWGSGPGTYTGTIDTEDLFGQVWSPFGGNSFIDLKLDSVFGGVWGSWDGSELRLTLNRSLERDVLGIPVSSGGTQVLALDAGAEHAGHTYLLVGSGSGVTPGTSLGTHLLPLVVDPYTLFTAEVPNSQVLPDSLGTLDVDGRATAHVVVPPGAFPGLAGRTLHHAYVALDPAVGITFTSNPSTVHLLP